jgi:hypothetical protein
MVMKNIKQTPWPLVRKRTILTEKYQRSEIFSLKKPSQALVVKQFFYPTPHGS